MRICAWMMLLLLSRVAGAESLEATIKQYQAIVDAPGALRSDETVLRLIVLLLKAHQEPRARPYLERLATPQSRYLPDALVLYGDHLFEAGEPKAAQRLYERVTSGTNTKLGAYARYKRAWCAFNLGNFKDALSLFVKVAVEAGDPPVVNAARGDAVRALARTDLGPDRARDVLRQLGSDDKLVDQLAAEYHAAGRIADCRALATGTPCD